jgi:SPP1 gp7 family putative phage head morphogenesis protein
MLRTVHEELTRQIQKGANLREFKKWMTDRLKSEGYIGAVQPATGAFSAPHVETVFRTNVQGAYNSGRVRHAMQPEVLELLPIWEIRTIPDDRRRENHGRAHGQRLRADDPYWQTAYPPFGFNCRCVVVSQPATMEPTPGAWQGGLPDPGFVSGISSIF